MRKNLRKRLSVSMLEKEELKQEYDYKQENLKLRKELEEMRKENKFLKK